MLRPMSPLHASRLISIISSQVNDRLGRFATIVTKRRNNGRRIFGFLHPPITGVGHNAK